MLRDERSEIIVTSNACASRRLMTRNRLWTMVTMCLMSSPSIQSNWTKTRLGWFYDPKPLVDIPPINGASYRYWLLTLPVMTNLYRLGRTLLSDHTCNNASYLFDERAVFSPKPLNMAIPGGPKFEPLYRGMDAFHEDWIESNEINKIIIRVSKSGRNTRSCSLTCTTPFLALCTAPLTTHLKTSISICMAPTYLHSTSAPS